jgi:hypothetical protein
MLKAIDAIAEVLENPDIKKGYRNLKKYYEETGRSYEAESIAKLIETKFKHESDSKPPGEKQ